MGTLIGRSSQASACRTPTKVHACMHVCVHALACMYVQSTYSTHIYAHIRFVHTHRCIFSPIKWLLCVALHARVWVARV